MGQYEHNTRLMPIASAPKTSVLIFHHTATNKPNRCRMSEIFEMGLPEEELNFRTLLQRVVEFEKNAITGGGGGTRQEKVSSAAGENRCLFSGLSVFKMATRRFDELFMKVNDFYE